MQRYDIRRAKRVCRLNRLAKNEKNFFLGKIFFEKMNDSEFMRENIFVIGAGKPEEQGLSDYPNIRTGMRTGNIKLKNQKIRNASGGGYTLLYINNYYI